MVERGQDDLGQLGRRVDDDVVEVPPQRAHDLVDVLGRDHVGVGRAERRRQHRKAQLVLLEVLLDVLVEVVFVDRSRDSRSEIVNRGRRCSAVDTSPNCRSRSTRQTRWPVCAAR